MLSSTNTVSTSLGMTPPGTMAPVETKSAPASPQHHHQHHHHLQQPMMPIPAGKKEGLGYASGLLNPISSCFSFILPGIFRRPQTDSIASYTGDDWEIPFESITNLEWLGAGSQGAVFTGKLNAQVVAVKKVKELRDTETSHLRHLAHRNIVKFMGVCTQAPCFCLVMEFCSNGQLNELLSGGQPIPHQRWVDMARQVAAGMSYLHANKIVHRDLKSPNILVAGDGTMKISDFGTSQHWKGERDSALMSFCGTVSWMAPEMIKKEPCSEKVDIWSFGVVLWEMVTCELPYRGIDSMAVLFGVGSGKLALPMPTMLPDGLRMLIQQCWSQKPRNRPSFQGVLQHLDILGNELAGWGEAKWQQRYEGWKAEARAIKYPETLQGHPGELRAHDEQEQIRKRKEELKHAQDIRVMYETKFRRCNRMYQKLTTLLEELDVREKELLGRERDLAIREGRHYRGGSFSGPLNHRGAVVVRAGPRSHRGEATADVFSTHVAHPSLYGADDGMSSSSGEEQVEDEIDGSPDMRRGSPYRCSQASSWSGHPSFSRQSSLRSSQGLRPTRPSPLRPHNASMSPSLARESAMRHSSSSQQWSEFARNCPARHSGFSEDSGIQLGPSRVNSCSILEETGPMTPQHPSLLTRAHEGRWSDGSARRRTKRPRDAFRRDSPARLPQVRHNRDKEKRASCPVQLPERELSVVSQQSDTIYDNYDRSASVAPSSSYDEALANYGSTATLPPALSNAMSSTSVSTIPCRPQPLPPFCPGGTGYSNPLYASPISTYENPLVDPSNLLRVHPNVDLASSIDSNNPGRPEDLRDSDSDASGESSSEAEGVEGGDVGDRENGNIFESSLDSNRASNTFRPDEVTAVEKRHRELMLLESSSMASSLERSLERSLEMAAIHSDGLSDRETALRRVQRTIKTHRRTHSGGQPVHMAIVDETSTESDESEAVAC